MTATFFGHRDTPSEIETELRLALTDLIKNENVTVFYVGNNGSFDYMVKRVLEDLSVIYPINYNIVLPYLPVKKNEYENFENTVFPEGLEAAPKWISVEERLPDDLEEVLILVKETEFYGQYKELSKSYFCQYIGCVDDGEWFTVWCHGHRYIKDTAKEPYADKFEVTHWMPLPELPKEEK